MENEYKVPAGTSVTCVKYDRLTFARFTDKDVTYQHHDVVVIPGGIIPSHISYAVPITNHSQNFYIFKLPDNPLFIRYIIVDEESVIVLPTESSRLKKEEENIKQQIQKAKQMLVELKDQYEKQKEQKDFVAYQNQQILSPYAPDKSSTPKYVQPLKDVDDKAVEDMKNAHSESWKKLVEAMNRKFYVGR